MARKKQGFVFEDAVERLGEIAAEMETAPLAECAALYGEGVELALKCGEALDAAEAEVTALREKLGGGFVLEKFEL